MKHQNTVNKKILAWMPAVLAAVTLAFTVAFAGVQQVQAAPLTTGAETKAVQTTDSGIAPMYRLYKPASGEHLYTTDANEKRVLTKSRGWKYEGIAWYAPKKSSIPVTRLYNPESGEHHYTADKNEIRVLTKKRGWIHEGVKFYSSDAKKVLVNRLYSPTAKRIAQHHYTTDSNEVRVLTKVRKKWVTEKSMIYCLKTSYTVKFNANGGTGSMATKSYDSLTKYTLPGAGFKKSGYNFAGWSTSPKGGVVYKNKAAIKGAAGPGKTLTLYAQWKKIPPYTIRYVANPGFLHNRLSGTMPSQNVDINTTVNLKACAYKIEDYRFLRWTTKADGTGASYADKASVKNLAKSGETITLYAVWGLKPPREGIKVPAIKSKVLNQIIGCSINFDEQGGRASANNGTAFVVETSEINSYASGSYYNSNMWAWDRAAMQKLIDMNKAYVSEDTMEVVWVDYDYWQRWNKGHKNGSAAILSWEGPAVCDDCLSVVGNKDFAEFWVGVNYRSNGVYGTGFNTVNSLLVGPRFKNYKHYGISGFHELGTQAKDFR